MTQSCNVGVQPRNSYPTRDGRPFDSDLHRDLMVELIETLKLWFAADPSIYVSGNLLVFYEKENKKRHVSPDVLVVPGVGNHRRENYLLWEEGRGLDFVIELTSRTTMIEDIETKHNLYVEKLAVKEYFLFDPKEEYLTPSFQGYRKVGDRFRPIRAIDGRMPSRVLGLHLMREGTQLRLWDPKTAARVPTPNERAEAESARADAEAARAEAEAARAEAESARADAEAARAEAEAARASHAENEAARLRRDLEQLRRLHGPENGR